MINQGGKSVWREFFQEQEKSETALYFRVGRSLSLINMVDSKRNYLLRQNQLRVVTGLSISVAGVKLTMVQHPATKTVTMRQDGEVPETLGEVGQTALRTAIDFLRLRAARVLGPEWKIEGLLEQQPTLPPVVSRLS